MEAALPYEGDRAAHPYAVMSSLLGRPVKRP